MSDTTPPAAGASISPAADSPAPIAPAGASNAIDTTNAAPDLNPAPVPPETLADLHAYFETAYAESKAEIASLKTAHATLASQFAGLKSFYETTRGFISRAMGHTV